MISPAELAAKQGRSLSVQVEYDGSNNPLYIGYAKPGTPTGATGWMIAKITYDASGNPTAVQYAFGSAEAFQAIWDLRATYLYS